MQIEINKYDQIRFPKRITLPELTDNLVIFTSTVESILRTYPLYLSIISYKH